MAFVQLDVNGNVTGLFAGPQSDPVPPGYAVIDDADPRIAAFRAAQAAAQKPRPTPREWFERLAPATRLAIETAALSNAQIREWLDLGAGNPAIDVTNAETIAGVQALLAAGLISAAEQTALLTP